MPEILLVKTGGEAAEVRRRFGEHDRRLLRARARVAAEIREELRVVGEGLLWDGSRAGRRHDPGLRRGMPRVRIDLPDTFPFETEIPIRIDDINYGGHLGNDAVLSLAHEARVRLLRAHGWSELDVAGAGIIMVDAAVVYRAEGRHGVTLRVQVAFDDVRSRGCDLVYRLTDAATGEEIARAKTGIVFFDYGGRRVVPMPEPFRAVAAGGAAPAAPRAG